MEKLFDTTLPAVMSRTISRSLRHILMAAVATKERRKPRFKRLAATGGAGRTTKEKLYIIGCVYDRNDTLQKRGPRRKKSRPKSAGVIRSQVMNSVRKRSKQSTRKTTKSVTRRKRTRKQIKMERKVSTNVLEKELGPISKSPRSYESKDIDSEERAGEEETTVLGDLKKKDIDSRLQQLRQKMNSFEKEEDGDNLGFSEEKDYESDDFDPPIEIQGEFLPPSRAVEDFMEEIEDSPFQRDGMGLLVDYISSAHAAAEIQESAGALEPAPILEQGTINKLA